MDELIKKLEAFLAEKKECVDMGWPEVTRDELCEFKDLVEAIADAKWERDVDGDSPVKFAVTNRTTHSVSPFIPVPYYWMDKNDDADRLRAYDNLMFNLRVASGDLDRFFSAFDPIGFKSKWEKKDEY